MPNVAPRIALLAALAALSACQTQPLRPGSVQSRLAAQNAILEAEYQFDLKMNPLHATEVGDHRYDDRLPDMSLAAARTIHSANVEFLARLESVSIEDFSAEDALSHELMLRKLRQALDDDALKLYEMPVSQMNGPQIDLADLPLSMPFDSVKAYENYLSRLRQIPGALAQTRAMLRAGMHDHLMPVRFLLEKVPSQCAGLVAANPFLTPLKSFPDSIPPEERQRLTNATNEVVSRDVLPAIRDFGDFIANEYAPHGRTALSIESLPGGRARYLNDIRRETTQYTLSPGQIHALGLAEVARIEDEMLRLAQSQGYADAQAYRSELQQDPRYRPSTAQQIVDDFRRYVDRMRPRLPQLFGTIPADRLTVEAIPDFEPEAATHYQIGSPDGSRAARVVVATSDFAHRSLLDDEATAYHEGIPGHHLQGSVQQSLMGLPKFRQHDWTSGYGEGWALYAEGLGKEVGFYEDPGSDFGRLSSELFRAVRLVVDTGIHDMGWSREQVVEYMRQSQAVDEATIQAETDRYIAWPAQALAYKLGQLKFLELRERSRQALGDRFDIRTFHDEMLNGGVLPLDLLDQRTDRWIHSQLMR